MVSSKINRNSEIEQLKGLMRPVCHSLGHVFIVLTFAKSNDIANFFVKSILVAVGHGRPLI